MGFAALLALLLGVALFSLGRLHMMHTESALTLDDRYPKIVAITDIKNNLNQIARSMRNTLLMSEARHIAAELNQIDADNRNIDRQLDYLDQHIHNADGRVLLSAVMRERKLYFPAQELFMRAIRDEQFEVAKELLMTTLRPQQLRYFAALDQSATFQATLMKQAGAQVATAYADSVTMVSTLSALSMVVGALVAWRIGRSITEPLRRAIHIAQTVAAGDLTRSLVVTGTDETARLLQALMAMRGSLHTIVGEVRKGTDTIATASSQIAIGNLDLSARTEQQASSLEQTAAAMEELTGTVRQSADSARQANQLAVRARDIAVNGGVVVGQVVDTMVAIGASGKKMGEIIGVIDSIAFQTNILALNAAVEAARAGEQGRGFAVVAAEVRNLAHRSASAAKDIKHLIGESVGAVQAGTELVDSAGAAMREIVDSVNRVTEVMGHITAASQEQSVGIDQINQAIMQMDAVTQQNAALVEQAAAAAASLQAQASTLTQVVSVFKVGTADTAIVVGR